MGLKYSVGIVCHRFLELKVGTYETCMFSLGTYQSFWVNGFCICMFTSSFIPNWKITNLSCEWFSVVNSQIRQLHCDRAPLKSQSLWHSCQLFMCLRDKNRTHTNHTSIMNELIFKQIHSDIKNKFTRLGETCCAFLLYNKC